MKVIYLQSIVLLLSASTAVARDVEGYLRQDTHRSSIINEQQLINGIKELQVEIPPDSQGVQESSPSVVD